MASQIPLDDIRCALSHCQRLDALDVNGSDLGHIAAALTHCVEAEALLLGSAKTLVQQIIQDLNVFIQAPPDIRILATSEGSAVTTTLNGKTVIIEMSQLFSIGNKLQAVMEV